MLRFAASSPIVVWSAIWKILVASLVGGAGVAIVFGFVILGTERAQADGASGTTKALNYSIALVAAAFCIFAIVVGIHAMTEKS
jgi:preprotein translocase subunit SecG